MIKLTLAQINDQDFVQAIVTLSRAPRLEQKTAYRAGRVLNACKSATDKLREKERAMILDKGFALKNDKGEPTFDHDGSINVEPAKKAEHIVEFKKLAESMVVDIKVMPIEFANLAPAGLTPGQLIALEPIVTGFPEDESGESEVTG